MTHNRPFQVAGINKFQSQVPLEQIKNDLKVNKIPYCADIKVLITKEMYGFLVNGSPEPLHTKLICKADELESSLHLTSDHKYNFPTVDFDDHVSYGEGCGGDDIQYNFDFKEGVVYITGSGIYKSLGAMPEKGE